MDDKKFLGNFTKLQQDFMLLEQKIQSRNLLDKRDRKRRIRQREILEETLKDIDRVDLEILFYVRNITGLHRYSLLRSLKNLYKAECEYKNTIGNKTEENDPF